MDQHGVARGSKYLIPLSMMSGILIPDRVCMEEYPLRDVNLLNRSQYLEKLVSKLRVDIPGLSKIKLFKLWMILHVYPSSLLYVCDFMPSFEAIISLIMELFN